MRTSAKSSATVGGWARSGVIFAVDQLLAVGRLDALVAEFQARQPDADQRQKGRAKQRPDDRDDHQRIGDLADERKFGDVRRKLQSTGRKAISVITESMRLTPSPSMVVENRMVSSCTRCEAPSMWRSLAQLAM